jgi:hypothetical protein
LVSGKEPGNYQLCGGWKYFGQYNSNYCILGYYASMKNYFQVETKTMLKIYNLHMQ